MSGLHLRFFLEQVDVLAADQRKWVEDLLVEFGDVFSRSDIYDLSKADCVEHDIKVMDEHPFKQHYRTIPPIYMRRLENTSKRCLMWV